MKLQVYSDINKLQTILLHRPGLEIENLTPTTMGRLLFDDIPYLKKAIAEHNAFADLLTSKNIEVLYVEDLTAQILKDEKVKDNFLKDFIEDADLKSETLKDSLYDFYKQIKEPNELAAKLITGVRRTEINIKKSSLYSMLTNCSPLLVDPIPNMYFTRDTISAIGNGVSLNKMNTATRSRESLFYKYIFENHTIFKEEQIPLWYDKECTSSIEGGDILVISDKIIAIGISERTSADGIEKLAKNIFSSNEPFETILAFDIPKKRASMHLDTVFTMIDHDAFTIHPEIEGSLSVFALHRTSNDGDYEIEKKKANLETILKEALGLKSIRLIRCGDKSIIDARREQWNDGSNTLAIAPGEVIVYSRNHVTNELMRQNGIKTYEIDSSELSRGRGGPRCMSMALRRER